MYLKHYIGMIHKAAMKQVFHIPVKPIHHRANTIFYCAQHYKMQVNIMHQPTNSCMSSAIKGEQDY